MLGWLKDQVELFIAVGALITSIVAIVIGMQQTKILREDVEINTRPLVNVKSYVFTDDALYQVSLENNGLGPAVINDYALLVGENEFSRNPLDHVKYATRFIEKLGDNRPEVSAELNTNIQGTIINAGGSTEIMKVYFEDEVFSSQARSIFQEHVKANGVDSAIVPIFICYCSLLDKCWVTSNLVSVALNRVPSRTCSNLSDIALDSNNRFIQGSVPEGTSLEASADG